MKGLANVGNTCYLNAALQCLVHTPGLTNYVLSGWADKDSFKKRINACSFAAEYASLTKAYWGTADPPVLDTRGVWTTLTKVHKAFANSQPHDAHEAVLAIIKHLHEAWARTPRIAPSIAEEHVVREAWDGFIGKEGYSLVTELFVGQVEKTLEAGEYRSKTYEHFFGLSLDLDGCSSVGHALHKHLAPEEVEEYRVGDRVTSATLTKHLVYCPLALIIHLKRFDGTGAKVDRFLDYSTTLAVPGQGTYELYGVCFHQAGHYVAACEAGGAWRALDDDKVSELEVNNVVHRDAYVLFYKKRL